MALIDCPDCGQKISSEAPACLGCGRPINTSSSSAAPAKSQERKDVANGVFSGLLRFFIALPLLLFFGCVMCVGLMSDDSDSSGGASRSPTYSGSSSTSSPPAVYAAKVANIRRGPSTKHGVVRKANQGERLVYIEKHDEWYKLSTSSEANEQWIHTSVVLTEAEKTYRDSAQLKVGDWSWHRRRAYAIAEGQVTNVSQSPISNVTALVTFKTKGGQFITSDSALVEFNPLLPGQTSPWEVMAQWNPAMGTAQVEFKTLFGGQLAAYRE